MANQEHVERLLHDGVAAWNRWREETPTVQPDLTEADLSFAHLQKANLTEAYLQKANLTGAVLNKAILVGANLNEAIFHRAGLSEAYLSGANLSGSDLSYADLVGADLRTAILHKADFHEAVLAGARLNFVDLTGVNLSHADLRNARLFGANLSEVNLGFADLRNADLNTADLSRANLHNASLAGASCIQTNFSSATLTGCNVYGVAAWDVNLEGAIQSDLHIASPDGKTSITVDNLEVSQFLYLLLHHQKMRAVLDSITSKVVLILGRFGDRKPVLDALREALRRHPKGYIPVLFDFEPQTDRPILETVKTLANLARFIIADLTDPHMVRAELTAIIPNVPTVPVQPLIEGDAALPTEYESWALFNSFRPVYRYGDLSDLLANLTESVIKPVEAHVQARRL